MVYATLLSTGSSWLFLFVVIWISLLPDILCGMWDAYSAGGGFLANKVISLIHKSAHSSKNLLLIMMVNRPKHHDRSWRKNLGRLS